MKAMVLRAIGRLAVERRPLTLEDWPEPVPRGSQVRLRVSACGVCHTELDEIEGRTAPSSLPRIPGHQAVGVIDAVADPGHAALVGTRVGVAWIARACGACRFCQSGRENLCAQFLATGRDTDGGYAEYMLADAAYVHPIPDRLSDVEAAPLLCAGAIGWRSLALAGLTDGETLGLTGFGASAHLVIQMAKHRYPHSPVYVFARSERERAFARELGAAWAGHTDEEPPTAPDAIIDTTPVWNPVLRALDRLAPGGRLVINAIRKQDDDRNLLAGLDYGAHLWREKIVRSVANVTRQDVRQCLALAADAPLAPAVDPYPLDTANEALVELASGHVRGAKVLTIA